jgi:hypothetical protein
LISLSVTGVESAVELRESVKRKAKVVPSGTSGCHEMFPAPKPFPSVESTV